MRELIASLGLPARREIPEVRLGVGLKTLCNGLLQTSQGVLDDPNAMSSSATANTANIADAAATASAATASSATASSATGGAATKASKRTPRSRKTTNAEPGTPTSAPAAEAEAVPAGVAAEAPPAQAPVDSIGELAAGAPAVPPPESQTQPQALAMHPVQLTIEAISERVKTCMVQLKETDAMMRTLMKDTKKLCKKRASNGKPSNLTQPLGISVELAEFIGVDSESQMTRGAVTKAINEYAVREGLKLPNNGRIIKLDDKLAVLLGKEKDSEIPIINVQTHLREHYRKSDVQVAVEAAV